MIRITSVLVAYIWAEHTKQKTTFTSQLSSRGWEFGVLTEILTRLSCVGYIYIFIIYNKTIAFLKPHGFELDWTAPYTTCLNGFYGEYISQFKITKMTGNSCYNKLLLARARIKYNYCKVTTSIIRNQIPWHRISSNHAKGGVCEQTILRNRKDMHGVRGHVGLKCFHNCLNNFNCRLSQHTHDWLQCY